MNENNHDNNHENNHEHNHKKPHARNNKTTLIPLLSAFGIIIVALIIWAVIYISTAQPPVVSTGNNPFSQTFGGPTTGDTVTSTGEVDPPVTDDPPTTAQPPVTDEGPKAERKSEYYNFLVCGRDLLGVTTDTIMIVSYDVKNDKMSVLQILRDTYVIDTADENKGRRINSVFTAGYRNTTGKTKDKIIGGMKALKTVVEDTFGIAIDKYVYVDLNGFERIVDAVGGVGVTIQQDMFYEDPGQDLYIDLKAGYKVLNGDEALDFVRFRADYAEGDLGRVDAQKIFMSAFIKKLLSASTVGKLPNLLNTVYDYLVTDLTTSDCTYFIRNVTGVSLDNILFYTTPGQYYRKDNGAVYYSLYSDENLEIINKGFNCMTLDISKKNMNLKQVVRDMYADRISTEGKSVTELIESPPNIIFNK